MTSGELARLFNEAYGIGCDLEVVPMEGWARAMWMDDTDAPWVMPSPNMPTVDTAAVFPGTVHLEGTQMSEGRGTTRPFELVGAPYIDAEDFGARLNGLGLRGRLLPADRLPAHVPEARRQELRGRADPRARPRPLRAGQGGPGRREGRVRHVRGRVQVEGAPYEYVFDKNPFDVISGTDADPQVVREGPEPGRSRSGPGAPATEAFRREREKYLLY